MQNASVIVNYKPDAMQDASVIANYKPDAMHDTQDSANYVGIRSHDKCFNASLVAKNIFNNSMPRAILGTFSHWETRNDTALR